MNDESKALVAKAIMEILGHLDLDYVEEDMGGLEALPELTSDIRITIVRAKDGQIVWTQMFNADSAAEIVVRLREKLKNSAKLGKITVTIEWLE